MAVGHVLIHREAMDHPVFQDDWLWRLFCWCIMSASYKDGRNKRGSFTTGRNIGSAMLGVSPSKFYRGLHKLQELGCITIEVNSNWTTLTVCNYETYQSSEFDKRTASEQRADSKRTASEQRADTDRNKSIREEGKKGIETPFPQGLDSPEFADAWASWTRHRTELRKPLKPTQAAEQLKMLAGWGEPRAIAAIRHTIAMGWQGIREPEASLPGIGKPTEPKLFTMPKAIRREPAQ